MASRGLEEQLECPICFDRYDLPKVLPCQHTFCATCLRGLEESGNVRCPECREVHRVPENGFPINITMQRLLSASEMPNVPTTNIPISQPVPSRSAVQPTAPPMEPPPSRLPPVYPAQSQPIPQFPAQYQPPQNNEQHTNYTSGQNPAMYGARFEQPASYPPQPQPLPGIHERNERGNQPPTASCQAARPAGRGNETEEDACDCNQCKTTFVKYFQIVRKGIRKVTSSFLGRYKTCMTVTILIFLVITFARFVAGAVKLSSDCSDEKHVAEYLFVKSWFAFLFWGVMLLLRCKERLVNAMDNLFIEVYVVIVEALFSLIWLIIGTAWTIGKRDEMIDECPFHVKDWNKAFINFAMVLVVFDWIAVAVFLFYCGYIQFDKSDEEEALE